MTDLKYSILEILYNATLRQEREFNLLNSKLATPTAIQFAINELISVDFIESKVGSDILKLSDQGAICFELLQEERAKQYEKAAEYAKHCAEEERQKRFLKTTTILSLIVATLSALVALAEFFLHIFPSA